MDGRFILPAPGIPVQRADQRLKTTKRIHAIYHTAQAPGCHLYRVYATSRGTLLRSTHPAIYAVTVSGNPRIGCSGRLGTVLCRQHHAVNFARLPLKFL